MKIIMYHNIKKYEKKLPYQNFLDIKKFEKQIKFFKKKYGLISSKKEIFKENNKILLTFDDGFKHHLKIAKILDKHKSIGLFFICSKPLIKKTILPVHKIHLILSQIKPEKALEYLKKIIREKKIFFKFRNILRFKKTYENQLDSYQKKEFKRIINYFMDNSKKNSILNQILRKFKINYNINSYYLNSRDILKLYKMGMLIGNHGYSHDILSNMSLVDQEIEISYSKTILEKIIKDKIDFFCYPYGGPNSYNSTTLKLLKKNQYSLSFDVKPNDVNLKELIKNPYRIPRYDCNLF